MHPCVSLPACSSPTGPASHPGANFVVLSSDGARIWLRDEKIRRKLAAELKVRNVARVLGVLGLGGWDCDLKVEVGRQCLTT